MILLSAFKELITSEVKTYINNHKAKQRSVVGYRGSEDAFMPGNDGRLPGTGPTVIEGSQID